MASGQSLLFFYPNDAEQPVMANHASASFDTRNGHPCVDFDPTTIEAMMWTGVMPAHYNGGGFYVVIHVTMSVATSGTMGWYVDFEPVLPDLDTDLTLWVGGAASSLDTVSTTSGLITAAIIPCAAGEQSGYVTAGLEFRLRVRRQVADTAAGDAEVLCIELVEI